MILMKGSDRILEKPLVEQSGSTSQLKLLSIYGITSYSQLYNVPITIVNSTGSDTYVNININSLGVKSLKYKGITALPTAILQMNTIYTIMYDGTDFILQLLSPSSGTSNMYTQEIPNAVLSLTNSSTSSDITTAFGGASKLVDFMNSLEDSDHVSYIVDSTTNQLLTVLCTKAVTSGSVGSETETDTIQVIVPSTKKLVTLELVRVPSGATYTSVTKTEEDLGGSTITVEDSLTSGSTVNPPSVHAVSDALGQINTILTNILS